MTRCTHDMRAPDRGARHNLTGTHRRCLHNDKRPAERQQQTNRHTYTHKYAPRARKKIITCCCCCWLASFACCVVVATATATSLLVFARCTRQTLSPTDFTYTQPYINSITIICVCVFRSVCAHRHWPQPVAVAMDL